jgi:flagellar biogenesis protein FliO
MSVTTIIILLIIALHLILGFGWLIWKLGPRKKTNDSKESQNMSEEG